MTETGVPGGQATIINSGSTNRSGYRVCVHASGRVERESGSIRGSAFEGRGETTTTCLTEALASRFFNDLGAALPFSQYDDPGCVKSASFGFSLRIAYGTERSPDLACPLTDARLAALARDVQDIERAITPT